MMKIMTRSVLSVLAVVIYGWINYLLHPASLLLSGKTAGMQFQPSDMAYAKSYIGMDLFKNMNLSILVLLAVLIGIWWGTFRRLRHSSRKITIPIVLLLLLGMTLNAQAYYNKEDWNESYFILPNESAFWIPDVGDNKSSQASFMSEQYLAAHKIAAKRFTVPHTKLENSGYWSNFYVPSGRLIIVDRTPYAREWVSQGNRGTSAQDQGFPLQSKEGLNITVGVSIAASVTEGNCPKFLYHFGVLPPRGNRTDPQVVFTTVYYGKSLTQVMDTVVRFKVQSMLGDEFTSRTFNQDNADAGVIMADVQKKLSAWLADYGITLDYIGWADTFSFDQSIQSAINRRFIATQDMQIAQSLAPYTGTLEALAFADSLREFGVKFDGHLPTSLSLWWMPQGLSNFLGDLVNGKKGAVPEAAPARRK
jgi:hypothetical protein